MSVSGTPVTTYDDGFPKAHPSLPPSTRRSGRGVGQRRTLVELTDDHGRTQACRRKVGGTHSLQVAHERLATRVVDPTLSTTERAGGVGGALGNPSSYVGTGVPATDRWAVGQTVRSGSQGPTRPTRPVDRRRLGRHSFELRHYGRSMSGEPALPGMGRAESSSVRKRQQVGVDEVVASGLRSDPPVEDVAAGTDDPDAITIGRRWLCPSGHFATRAMSFDELLDVVKDSHDGPPAQNPSKVGAAADDNADRGAPRPASGPVGNPGLVPRHGMTTAGQRRRMLLGGSGRTGL